MEMQATPPAPQAEQGPAYDLIRVVTTDEHAGRGGSYTFDPATGKRTPAPQPPEQET